MVKTKMRSIIKAKKKMFVAATLLGDSLKLAARKSGFSLAEARVFHRSGEFSEMSGYLWDRYCKKHVDVGGKKIFVSVIAALGRLQNMVRSKNPDVCLRAVGELRQWVTNLGKSEVLAKLAENAISEYDESENEVYDNPRAKRKAMELLTVVRKANGYRRH